MIYTKELDLVNFNFWSGAKQHEFTYEELKDIEISLEEFFQDRPPTETEINDTFWFNEEFLCECLGLDFEEYENR